MNAEYIITKEHIMEINEKYGGSIRSDAEIETALERGKGRSLYKKIAYLWKSILVGHPFTDGNKRTALMVALVMLEKCMIGVDDKGKENMVSEIRKVASENITDVNRIERMIRYAVEGN